MRNRNNGNSAPRSARTRTAAVAVAVAASLAAVSAHAQAHQRAPFGTVAASEPAPPLAPLGIVLSAGMRSDLIRSAGLDPFSGTDSISQGALGVGYRFGEVDAAGLAVGFEWNRGSVSAGARSAATDLTIDRLTLGIEGRFPIVRRLAVFVRLAPGLLRSQAHWYDQSAAPAAPYEDGGSSALTHKKWSPAVDAGAGVAFRFGDLRSPGLPSVSLWLVADGGFGFSPGHELTLRNQSQPLSGRTDEPIHLGNLSLSGGFARLRLAASF